MPKQGKKGKLFMNIREEYQVLFELGCDDLKLVEKNLNDKEIKEQLLLFHLQQAVEKILKSLLAFSHIKYTKTHDLAELIELCKDNAVSLPEYIEEFIELTPFAVEFRYGFIVDESLDVSYYYEKVLDFKKKVKLIAIDAPG